ncbi:RidA family protein [Sphingomonas sp.]|uniref:RidA family protein n=1 Tax=Sphingomonas sp. TaxID=28214 RepID=UPI002B83ECC9|nr:RidA family protein [Sphingomonas sp.]HWK35448.1 RidA family protein [Sphingomonas sp.]
MTRISIDVDGLTHGALPIPTASRIGPFLATGGIRGVDPATHALPDDPQAQADLMFDNLRLVLEAAGAAPGDVLKLTVWLCDGSLRPIVNPGWLRLFPDPASRPARHVLIQALPGAMAIQCEALAVVAGAVG